VVWIGPWGSGRGIIIDVSPCPAGVGMGGWNVGVEGAGLPVGLPLMQGSVEGRLPRLAPQSPPGQEGPSHEKPPQSPPHHPGPQPSGPGVIGPQQLPQLIGQQPLQQMVPKQVGVKALYCLQQMVAQQSWQQHPWKKHQAEARGAAKLARPRVRAASVSSFFMA